MPLKSNNMLFFEFFLVLILREAYGESCKAATDVGQATCSRQDPLEVCQFDFEKLELPVTYKELEHICNTLYSYYSCYDEHKDEFLSAPLTGYALMLANIKYEADSLCNEKSDIHKGYFKYADCFKKLRQDWPLISFIIEKNSERMVTIYKKISNDKFAASIEHCMKGMQKLQTIKQLLLDECGSDAVRFFQRFLDVSKYKTLYCTDNQYLKVKMASFAVFEAIFTNKISKNEMLFDTREIPKELKANRKIRIPVGGMQLD